MPAKIPDKTRAAILEDIRAKAGSTRAIAARHGVSDATVRKIAKDEGETEAFTREHTEKATRARVADMAELRTRVAQKYLRKADELLDQIDEPHTVFSFGGKDNSYNEHTFDRPPTGDIRNLMTSSAVAVDKHLKLIAADVDSGAATAASMLSGIADALQVASEVLDGETPEGS